MGNVDPQQATTDPTYLYNEAYIGFQDGKQYTENKIIISW